jgi:hypothetical protein
VALEFTNGSRLPIANEFIDEGVIPVGEWEQLLQN